MDDLQVTASYGESFRSSLKDVDPNNAPNVTVNRQYFDYSVNRNVSAIRWLGGNAELKPETAETKTFGLKYAPQALPGFVAAATYFDIAYEDIIDQPGGNVAASLSSAAQEAIFGAYIIRRPPAADVAGNAAFNALVQQLYADPAFQTPNPPASSTISLIVDNRGYNAGSLKTQGIDLSLSYAWETGLGEWITRLDGSYFLEFERSLTAADPLVDRLDYIDFPTSYRARAQLGWRKGSFGVNLYANYIPSYTNTNTTPAATVDDTTTLDLNLSYRTGTDAPIDMLSDITISFSAQNVLDQDPPYALIGGDQAFDSNYSNPIGRLISLQVMKAW
jgi:iron complex outermembrane receptor protein